MELRPYQQAAREAIEREWEGGRARTLAVGEGGGANWAATPQRVGWAGGAWGVGWLEASGASPSA